MSSVESITDKSEENLFEFSKKLFLYNQTKIFMTDNVSEHVRRIDSLKHMCVVMNIFWKLYSHVNLR